MKKLLLLFVPLLLTLTTFSQSLVREKLYLQTDRTFYKPNEDLWFSAFLREGTTLLPSLLSQIITVELIAPNGTIQKTINIVANNGIAKGDFHFESDAKGGLYKLRASTNFMKNFGLDYVFEKEIQVQTSIYPKLLMKLEFLKKAYGKNDSVIAKLDLSTLENRTLSDCYFNFTVQLKGNEYLKSGTQTDSKGTAHLRFRLPDTLTTNDGLLNVVVDYQGSKESISRSIPIVLNDIDLQFLPEGGQLVADLDNRIAFIAINEFGKPADIEGLIIEDSSKIVTNFKSYHDGMGTFWLNSPQKKSYKARITKPEGITKLYDLPKVLDKGCTMQIIDNKANSVSLKVHTNTTKKIFGVVSFTTKVLQRFEIVDTTTINLNLNCNAGIARITIFDSEGEPQCERLVFVNKHQQMNVKISTNKETYAPREKVQMTIQTTDNEGNPLPSQLALAVVDDKNLTFADDKQDNILSHLLMSSDLKGKIYEPQFYFKPNEPKADSALDLVMMTHGWRKFLIQKDSVKYKTDVVTITGKLFHKRPCRGAIKVTTTNTHGKSKRTIIFTDKTGRFSFEANLLDRTEFFEEEGFYIRFDTKPIESYNKTSSNTYAYYLDDDIIVGGINIMEKDRSFSVTHIDMEKVGCEIFQGQAMVIFSGNSVDLSKIKNNSRKKQLFIIDGVPLFDTIYQTALSIDPYNVTSIKVNKEALDCSRYGVDEIIEIVTKNGLIIPEDEYYYPTRVITSFRTEIASSRTFYSPKYNPKDTVKERRDFRSTIYWNPIIVTDTKGIATVSFCNSDESTTFRAITEGISTNGKVGRSDYTYHTQQPLSMSVKVPMYLTFSDKVNIPLTFKNTTDSIIKGKISINSPKSLKVINPILDSVQIEAKSTKTFFLNYVVENQVGKGEFHIQFSGSNLRDAFRQSVEILPKGFPTYISVSGNEVEKKGQLEIGEMVEGSLKSEFTVYTDILHEAMAGIESILSEPHGCFEQVSSSTYPNVLVLNYLQKTGIVNYELKNKALRFIENGYKKLAAYETILNGFEWFGHTPPHETLTAYGLMEFYDMQKVYNGISESMLKRTKKWLLGRKDGKGGFKQNYGKWSFTDRNKDINNAYLVYALSETQCQDIENELFTSYQLAKKDTDVYKKALVANAFLNRNDTLRADTLLSDIYKEVAIKGFGKLPAYMSVTSSYGYSLQVETAAFVLLAAMKAKNVNQKVITEGMKYLCASRTFDGFGSTQATILALKALTQYAIIAPNKENGHFEFSINERKVIDKSYRKEENNSLNYSNLDTIFKSGKQNISIRFSETKKPLPYSLTVSYNTKTPPSSANCKVDLQTNLSQSKAKMGETVRLTTTLQNKTQNGLPMTLAVIGIPSGLSVQPWQLKELQDKKAFNYYETFNNYLVFYYTELEPNAKKVISLDLKTELSGTYEAPASSAYLYYTNEFKSWVKGETIEID